MKERNPKIAVGDLVVCYITNTTQYKALLDAGIVLDINEGKKEIYVLSRHGHKRWWKESRWKLLKRKK